MLFIRVRSAPLLVSVKPDVVSILNRIQLLVDIAVTPNMMDCIVYVIPKGGFIETEW